MTIVLQTNIYSYIYIICIHIMWVVGTSSAVNPLKLINGCTSVNNYCFVGVAMVVVSEVSFNYRIGDIF